MALLLLLQDFVDGDQQARLLHVAEAPIDGRAERPHLWREAHVGIDEWRNVQPPLTYLLIQDPIILPKAPMPKERLHSGLVHVHRQRMDRLHQPVRIREMTAEEVEDHVARLHVVARIHGHLAEEISQRRVDHRQRPQPVPQVVEDEDAARPWQRGLIVERDERSPQLHRVWQVFPNKAI